jgi:ribosomal protein S18 acetylase RimI-like enzyme
VEVRAIQPSEVSAAYELLRACGWSHRLASLAEFEALLSSSQRAVVAVQSGGQVVGFARAITDGLSNGYLSMVAVAPQCRGRGIGRALVSYVTAGPSSVTWVVRAGREGASEFFAHLGFRASAVAMERPRE